MTLCVVSAPACIAVDTSGRVSAAQAKVLAGATIRGQRVRGIARYVPLPGNAIGNDIQAPEIDGLLAAGLGVWLVQHVLRPGWVATEQLGADLGGHAAEYARALGYRASAHLAVDQEGCASVGEPVARFLESWAKATIAQTYQPLVYEGFAAGLTAEQLYAWLPDVHAYWSDYGPNRAVATRGFEIVQHPQQAVAGLPFFVDADTIGADMLGDSLQWMVDSDVYPEVA